MLRQMFHKRPAVPTVEEERAEPEAHVSGRLDGSFDGKLSWKERVFLWASATWTTLGSSAGSLRAAAAAAAAFISSVTCSSAPVRLWSVNKETKVKFVHTSVHGVGHEFVQSAFKAFDLAPPDAVPQQEDPNPEFPTVKYPNPEEGKDVL